MLQTTPYGANMHLMRESWTDARLDDLNEKVDRGFERLDGRIDRLESRMDEKFDALYRLIMRIGGGIIIALVGVIATQL